MDLVHAAINAMLCRGQQLRFFFLPVKSGGAAAPPAPVLPARLSGDEARGDPAPEESVSIIWNAMDL